MRYPEYVYVPLGGLGDEWWGLYPETNSSCPHSLIAEMIIGSISIVPEGYFPMHNTSVTTTSGQVKCHSKIFSIVLVHKIKICSQTKNVPIH